MTRLRWHLDPDPNVEHCASCWAAAGQVHEATQWAMAHVTPRSRFLYCQDNCRCALAQTLDPERGQLSDIPLRGENAESENRMPDQPDAERLQLALTGEPRPDGRFEIVAITEGSGNGWKFSEAALRASLALWDGAHTFIDHEGWFSSGRSLRDLAGICSAPQWDALRRGIVLQLQPAGPSGPLLSALGREMLAQAPGNPAHSKPRVGFSADVLFTAGPDRTVKSILRVLSLDLVFDPARGGAFLRALQSTAAGRLDVDNQAGYSSAAAAADDTGRQEITMPEEIQSANLAAPAPLTPMAGQPAEAPAAAPEATAAQEAESLRQVRVQMCAYLLDSALASAGLPGPAADFVRRQFADRAFEPADLTAAIDAQRKLVASLTAGAVVQGPGRVSEVFSDADKLQAAVDDLLGAPRDEAHAALQVHRLSGIRELYHTLTGDHDYHGGFYPDRVTLATTADFTGLVKNAMNKIVTNTWARLGRAGYDWWRKIVTVEHFTSLQQITGTLVGSVGTLPSVAEGAEYTELAVGDSPETADFVKYGGYIPLTLELIDRDDSRKLAAYPRELANAALRRISGLVAAIFTDNAGVGPTLADTGALFNNTAVTTAGGHANLLVAALSAAQWETVSAAVYDQPLLIKNAAPHIGTGAKMAVNPRFLLVPRALQLTAMKIIYPTLENAANIYSENLQRGQPGDVVTVPEWTDATDWAAVVDPEIVPGIFVGERFGLQPEIFIAGDELSPAVFMNDEHRLKVRQFVAVWVNDFRPLHKSNVAG